MNIVGEASIHNFKTLLDKTFFVTGLADQISEQATQRPDSSAILSLKPVDWSKFYCDAKMKSEEGKG